MFAGVLRIHIEIRDPIFATQFDSMMADIASLTVFTRDSMYILPGCNLGQTLSTVIEVLDKVTICNLYNAVLMFSMNAEHR